MKKKREPTAVPRSSLEFLFVATRILLALAAVAETRRTGTRDDALPFSTMLPSVLHCSLPLSSTSPSSICFSLLGCLLRQSKALTMAIGSILYVGLCKVCVVNLLVFQQDYAKPFQLRVCFHQNVRVILDLI